MQSLLHKECAIIIRNRNKSNQKLATASTNSDSRFAAPKDPCQRSSTPYARADLPLLTLPEHCPTQTGVRIEGPLLISTGIRSLLPSDTMFTRLANQVSNLWEPKTSRLRKEERESNDWRLITGAAIMPVSIVGADLIWSS